MPRVLVFRHVPFEHLGTIEDSLAAAGLEWRYAERPELGDAAGVISMGGPMSANDALPWIRGELECLAEAAGRGLPVLGVCLGAQLLARALGGRVYRSAVREIGWAPIRLSDAARTDALLAGLPSPLSVFHWHGETFDLPAGAALLASSEACAHQAFRAARAAYGLQFHLEVTPEMIADWCGQEANCADVRSLAAPIDPRAHDLRGVARAVFDRWCRLL